MKKTFFITFAVAALACLVACQSSGGVDNLGKDFDKVYSTYETALNLEGAEKYTVQKGDTLSTITKNSYGGENGYYFPLIMLASNDVVKDPELIEPGMELIIPNFDANINNPDYAKGLSSYFKDIANVYKQKRTNASSDIRENLLRISNELKNK